jgi:hypothetical protein
MLEQSTSKPTVTPLRKNAAAGCEIGVDEKAFRKGYQYFTALFGRLALDSPRIDNPECKAPPWARGDGVLFCHSSRTSFAAAATGRFMEVSRSSLDNSRTVACWIS